MCEKGLPLTWGGGGGGEQVGQIKHVSYDLTLSEYVRGKHSDKSLPAHVCLFEPEKKKKKEKDCLLFPLLIKPGLAEHAADGKPYIKMCLFATLSLPPLPLSADRPVTGASDK